MITADIFNKCLALTFSLMILGQAYLVRRYVGTWLFPACLFGLFWFGYTFFPLAVLFWVPVQPHAIAFIFVCTLAFSMGSLLFDWRSAFQRNTLKRDTAARVYGSPFLRVIFLLSTLLSLIFLALNLSAQGFTLSDLLFDLYASAAAYADLHYSGDLNVQIFDRLSVIFAHLSVILGGFLFAGISTKTERRLLVVLSFLPSILVAITQSANGLLFVCIVFFYAGLLVHRMTAGKLYLFEKRSIKSLAIFIVVLIAIVTVSFLGRGLSKIEEGDVLISNIISRFLSYSCSHIYAFSDWFAFMIGRHSELTYTHEGTSYGYYTFSTLFAQFGIHKVLPPGVYDEYFVHGDLLAGNLYTMFRGLILDFGFIGSVLFMLAAGLLLHLSFHAMLGHKRPVFHVAVFVFMMSYFYYSFIISILIWSTFYMTFALLWIILQVNKVITQRKFSSLATLERTVRTVA